MSWVKAVGIGPGSKKDMTYRAVEALKKCDVVIGYKTYIKLLEEDLGEKDILSSGMRKETDRCLKAMELASSGKKVCVISSGDAGIYGMAGLLLELKSKKYPDIDVDIIPGVTAANAAGALLGAPIMHDFAVISLSDHLTPWETIENRLEKAAEGDFVIALYNPKSSERKDHLKRAWEIISKYKSLKTPVGIVKKVSRDGEKKIITDLSKLLKADIDMTTIIIIGNSNTYIYDDIMITPRGYVI